MAQLKEPKTGEPVVIDANIVVSLLIAKGSKHKLFFSKHIKPLSPAWVLFEIGKHWGEISAKSRLSENELNLEFSAVRMQLRSFSLSEIKKWLEQGKKISPDPDDAEYFALALKFNCPIWSHDKDLKEQSGVEVLNTKELLKKLGLA